MWIIAFKKYNQIRSVIIIEINFIIPGDPKGKQRPRFTRSGHTYTPKETTEYESNVQSIYNKYSNMKLHGDIILKVDAYFHIPKTLKKKTVTKEQRQLMIEGKIRPNSKPDWDNIGKIVSDALNKIAYSDDEQVVSAHVEKWYSENPRVEVTLIGEIEE